MVEQLGEGFWWLELGLFPPLASNAYLVDDGAVTLIDTGLAYNYPTIRRELDTAGYTIHDIDRVLLTHYDLDHTGGLARLADADAPAYLGERDVDLQSGAWTPSVFHHKGLFHRIVRHLWPVSPAFELRSVRDGDVIDQFTAYHTPGHNPGHTVYVHPNGGAFLGDLVWADDGRLTMPFWLDCYDMREARRSIQRLADRIEFDVACPGHGTPVKDPTALKDLAVRLSDGLPHRGRRPDDADA